MSDFVATHSIADTQNVCDVPPHLQWLKFEAPGFSVNGNQIKVLLTPDEFYQAIIKGCREANYQIALAALYIGMGDHEKNLVDVLAQRMTERGDQLKVTILLDGVRGARDESAGTLLLPLVQKHPSCQVCLFHNPEVRGLLLRFLPVKVNEVVGVQHIKLYVFDDNVIVSGANLTKEYFTDRQDRYMLVSNCQPLAEFCTGLIEKLSSVSLRLLPNNSIVPRTPDCHPYLSLREDYVKHAQKTMMDYYTMALKKAERTLRPGDDTWIFPVLQLPPLGIQQDSSVTQRLLEAPGKSTIVHMTVPYFNLPEKYITSLLKKCKATFSILIPHPTANDFFRARGFSGLIPALYTALAKSFLHRLEEAGQTERISLLEFSCPNGSFHCKGLWLTEQGDVGPYLTVTGSSNFNYRSVDRDLECQMLVVTRNQQLQESLREEYEQLYRQSLPFTLEVVSQPDRRPRLWQRIFLWAFKTYF